MYFPKFKKCTDNEIENNLLIALDELFKNDSFLFTNEVHERTIAHKLAEYLQKLFPGCNVDCEYNLHGIDTKLLPRTCNGKHQQYVYPDIIIHHRGYENNLLVIEIKTNKSDTVNECDNVKLKEFTKPNGKYKYQLGLFIGFEKLEKPQLVWYKNSEKVDKL